MYSKKRDKVMHYTRVLSGSNFWDTRLSPGRKAGLPTGFDKPCRLCSWAGFVNFKRQNRELQYARRAMGASRERNVLLSSMKGKEKLSAGRR